MSLAKPDQVLFGLSVINHPPSLKVKLTTTPKESVTRRKNHIK